MIEIRIHGRGGQGSVIASKLLATAAFHEGRYAQSFPVFGVERRGAPVTAFVRIDDKIVNLRTQVYEPDHLIVLDPSLLLSTDVTAGLKPGGWIVVNADRLPTESGLSGSFRIATVDASAIASREGLGSRTAPIVNTAILGAFARATGVVGIDAVCDAIREGAPVKAEANVRAARAAYEAVHCLPCEVAP